MRDFMPNDETNGSEIHVLRSTIHSKFKKVKFLNTILLSTVRIEIKLMIANRLAEKKRSCRIAAGNTVKTND